MKKIKVKCWVEDEGEKFYGPGPNELLKRIQEEGSLSRAASKMEMSYKKAWELVQRLNQHTEEPLVILKKGGQHGGGAEVTPQGLEIMREFENLQIKIDELVDQQTDLIKVLK
ncbi:molybdate transport system regulatory protein [Christiangramia gaetbulicola]|uniref:Molybdate transport system regulatory protein n=1 Tax=Christiangramia gaetbulicola TaxID=703340 RepID=A0A2T6ACB6_9FLAO|nr:winged helix-turn-helix domain-containing protein [Christiangramia gaetbulicola]PTX41461.1 molybdate transport system regulatory protein [Christiangramia gaetbulicola]